jgi:hypothetical protein
LGGGLLGATASRIRGKSAPPDFGPALKILTNQGRPQQTSIRFPINVPSSAPVPPSRLTESNLRAVEKIQQASLLITHPPPVVDEHHAKPSTKHGEHTVADGSDWYGRLMSRLQRLNTKLPTGDDVLRASQGSDVSIEKPREVDRSIEKSREAMCPSRSPGVLPRAGMPMFGLTGSRDQLRQQLQLNVNEEAPSVVVMKEASAPATVNQSMTVPQPLSDQRVCAPLDGENASMLLCELPSREERREMHAGAIYDSP